MLAMASCYSPNPQSPLGLDLPLDTHTAELDEDVWKRWLAQDPVHLVRRHSDALRALHLYFIDCGRYDEYHLQCGNRIYARRLEALDIPHVYDEFDGGHAGTSYRYDVSLQALSAAFERAT
jgi:enterochelin esterase family protein